MTPPESPAAPPPAATLLELLERNLPARAEHPALVHGATRVGYAELARRTRAAAAWLAAAGVRPGDRVGISLRKGVEEVVATLAVARLGAVFVNVNVQQTPRQLAHVARDCGMRVLVTDARRALALEDPARFERLVVVGAERSRGSVTRWEDWPSDAEPDGPGPRERDLAALLYTSGSTGLPKGVMVTHRNLARGAWSVASYLGSTPDDRVLGLLPLSFDYGLSQLTTMLHVGGTLVLQALFLPAEIARTARAERVTGIALVPPAWVALVRYLEDSGERLPDLRCATNSGGSIPRAILERMPAVFPGVAIVLMYGLTEAFRSTWLPPQEFARKRGAIGHAVPGEQVFVVDPERGLCGAGEIGELVHHGDLVSLGYWNDPEATAARIRSSPHLAHLIGDAKVVFSGDRVWRDEDGCLWFHGRADALIKSSGFRLSPNEVEELLVESGLVGEAVAFGVEDEELGQVVHAAVTALAGRPLDLDALQRFCRGAMPSYMIPRAIRPWSGPFPHTASGKLDRTAIVAACRAAPTAGAGSG